MTPTPGTLTLAEVRKRHIAVNAEAARSLWVDIYGEDAHDDRAFLIGKLDAAVKALGPFAKEFEARQQGPGRDAANDRIILGSQIITRGDLKRAAEIVKEIGAE